MWWRWRTNVGICGCGCNECFRWGGILCARGPWAFCREHRSSDERKSADDLLEEEGDAGVKHWTPGAEVANGAWTQTEFSNSPGLSKYNDTMTRPSAADFTGPRAAVSVTVVNIFSVIAWMKVIACGWPNVHAMSERTLVHRRCQIHRVWVRQLDMFFGGLQESLEVQGYVNRKASANVVVCGGPLSAVYHAKFSKSENLYLQFVLPQHVHFLWLHVTCNTVFNSLLHVTCKVRVRIQRPLSAAGSHPATTRRKPCSFKCAET